MNVESFNIDGWEEQRTGLILAENEEWLLVKNIPVDYTLDGFTVYKKSFISNRINGGEERLLEKVFTLKGVKPQIPDEIEFTDTIGFLKWSEQKFGLFEFQDEDNEALSYGKINKIIGNKLIIDFIDSKGNVEEAFDYEFAIDQIRCITFSTDYFEAIRLLYLDKLASKPAP
ncbi:hypothetical protein LRS05_10030 [Flavobacterium sp. J372]|uniref:hypothetical protein n=1 Tax=Flavobacterium sp. J372 TaxID=2898436 RepID=UPI0021507FDE|nr:hypothetical protein [Flavobacterium sp. J372]MCR5862464.1 hypothetical protein [Flavobacterium sp. J372]